MLRLLEEICESYATAEFYRTNISVFSAVCTIPSISSNEMIGTPQVFESQECSKRNMGSQRVRRQSRSAPLCHEV